MKDNIASITKWIRFGLIAIVIILGVLFYTNAIGADELIAGAKYLLYLGVVIVIISPVYSFIINPINLIKLLISIGLFVVIIIIGYSMASNTFTDLELETLKTTAETSRLVGTGLYVTYIAFGLTLLAAIFSSIIKAVK